MTEDKIRVLIADDHKVLAEGLGLYLGEDPSFEVVGATASGKHALDLAMELEPDVLLLDILMPDLDGLKILSALKAANSKTAVILLTSHRKVEYLNQGLALGAAGYLSKEIGLKMIPQAIRAILEGEAVIDRQLLKEALQASAEFGPVPGDPPQGVDHDLTEQEFRVLALLADGLSNDGIAEAMSISRNTVKTHVSRVYEKLGVSDRTQAAIWAIRRGIVT